MALTLSPSEAAQKWGTRTTAAVGDMVKGVDRVTEAPGVKAAAAADLALQNLIKAFQDGTWKAQVSKVTLEEWKRMMKDKGQQRIAQGVTAAQPAQAAMYERLFSAIEATLTEVNQTKRGDLEANINRMVTMARGMAKRKLRRPGA